MDYAFLTIDLATNREVLKLNLNVHISIKPMTNYSTMLDQLWALPVDKLHKLKGSIGDIIESKIKSSLYVDQEVYIVSKNKKENGVIKKVNKTRAVVAIENKIHEYNVPFGMIEVKN